MPPNDRALTCGGVRPIDGSGETRVYQFPADDLTTHGVVVGMTMPAT
jgi:hypothetical protein